jgi:lipoprotein-anchoring transpeptidase ErfK/SrfK
VVFNNPVGPPQLPAEFFSAAMTGDVERLRSYLTAGVDVNTALPLPAPAALTESVNPRTYAGLLLRQGNASALMFAAANRQAAAVDALLDAGANRYASTRTGTRPLDIAAELGDITGMQQMLGVRPGSDAASLSIEVDLRAQRATLLRAGIPMMTTEISSGRPDKPTPPGTYVVTQKYKEWRSTLYHNAPMPHFLRLSCGAVGLHAGYIPGHPASHGCIRLPAAMAKRFFDLVPTGTIVKVLGPETRPSHVVETIRSASR